MPLDLSWCEHEPGRARTRFGAALALLLAAAILTACGAGDTAASGTKQADASAATCSVGELRAKPGLWQGKHVTVEGRYLGWKGGIQSPGITRSDWVVADDSGAIYVTGLKPAGLHPYEDTGRHIRVRGVLHLAPNGVPYIQAEDVTAQ